MIRALQTSTIHVVIAVAVMFAAARFSIAAPAQRDTYTDTDRATLHAWVTPAATRSQQPNPTVILTTASSFSTGETHRLAPLAEYLARRGVTTVRAQIIDGSKDLNDISQHIDAVPELLGWVHANSDRHSFDLDRLAIVAEGSAAHAVTVGLHATFGKPDAAAPLVAVLLAPELDLDAHRGSGRWLAKQVAALTPEQADPSINAASMPPIHIIHARRESPWVIQGAAKFAAAVGDAGVPVRTSTRLAGDHDLLTPTPWPAVREVENALIEAGLLEGRPDRRLFACAARDARPDLGTIAPLDLPNAGENQRLAAFVYTDHDGNDIRFRYLKPDRSAIDAAGRLPLIISLQGGRRRADPDLTGVIHIPSTFHATNAYRREHNPAHVLVPHSPETEREWWSGWNMWPWLPHPLEPSRSLRLTREAALVLMESDPSIDPDRVYAVGHSGGGMAAISMAMYWPDFVRGVISIAGDVGRDRLGRLRGTSIQMMHGADDPVVSVDSVRATVEAMRAAGVDVAYTELPGVKHNSGGEFHRPELWDRLFAND